MAGIGSTREQNVQTPGWMRRPTASPSSGTEGDAAGAASQGGAAQGAAGHDGAGPAAETGSTQAGSTQAGSTQAGGTQAGGTGGGSRRTKTALLAAGGVGVPVVAGVIA